MDIITKRARAQKNIMSLINDIELTNDPSKDFNKVKNQMLEQDLLNEDNLTFAKQYFSEVMLSTHTQPEPQPKDNE